MHCLKRPLRIKTFILPVLLLFVFLSGCISPAEFTADPASEAGSSSEAQVRFPDYVYDPEEARYYSGNYAVSNEDGYYLAANRVLYFYDIQKDTMFPLCTKASCLHKDPACEAYIFDVERSDEYVNGWAANARIGWICHDRGQLYTIGVNPDKGTVLFRYDKDYHKREEIVWLADYEKAPFIRCIEDSILFHDRFCYYVTWLYQEDKVSGIEYETEFTAWRISLDQKEEPEELFSFDCLNTAALSGVRTGAFHGGIYFIIEHESQYILPDKERQSGEFPFQVTGGTEKVFRYDEKSKQEELLWSHTGDQTVSLFEAKGAMPRNSLFNNSTVLYGDSLVNAEGDYVYFAGYPERYEQGLMPTSIAAVNLNIREGKVLYRTPYKWIEQLRSDGRYYYFLERAMKQMYLTAIDKEGDLVRRYEIPLAEEFIKAEEERGEALERHLALAETEEDRERLQQALEEIKTDPGYLRLLITDGRHIVLGAYGGTGPLHKNLSSRVPVKFGGILVDDGIGLIDAGDFINGRDIEIRQIYERTDSY